jgi:glycogen debranching enzyme
MTSQARNGWLACERLEGERARRVLGTIERVLLTPLGLRSLPPDEPGYRLHDDGDAPHTPRGCPFRAWSLGELLRVSAIIEARLAESQSPARRSA